MTFGIFSYLVTTLIFAGVAVLIEWTLDFKKLKKYTKIITAIVAISLVSAFISETVALNWRIWLYSPDRTLGIYIGAPAETFVFTILVSIAISSATLIWSDYEEDKEPLIQTTIYKLRSKFQELFKIVK